LVGIVDSGAGPSSETHPDVASLVDPLFACGGKRVSEHAVYLTRCFVIKFRTCSVWFNISSSYRFHRL